MSPQRAELIYQLIGVVVITAGLIFHTTRRKSYRDDRRPWHRDPGWWALVGAVVAVVALILIGKYW